MLHRCTSRLTSVRPLALGVCALVAAFATSTATVTAHGPPSIGVYQTTAVAEIKQGPGTKSRTIRSLPRGKTFDVVGRSGGWLRVRLSEHSPGKGYVDERVAVAWKPDASRQSFAIPGTYVMAYRRRDRHGGRLHVVGRRRKAHE